MRKHLLNALGWMVAGYILLSLVLGNWVRTLIIFPAAGFVFLFTLYMAMGGWKRPR
jgi:uncharacterized membrane protein YjjP (DUF1212 family)